MVEITIATEVTDELCDAMERLVPQLSRSNPPPDRAALADIIESDASTLFVARDDTGILGTLTLVMFRIPTGIRAWIEDVIVDEAARGKGVGRLVNEAAVAHAFAHGAITVDLTSRPSREAANRLYQRIGFEIRDTAVYRYSPPEQRDS
ncbi:MAG: GNAT family N-acetyltransferase [Actinobacteria bacterium]|nr:GNAT family N-acetyltransferase [Actinomycetota bacterium]NIS31477.1 GNAT family N-acetyltransferase [Actinomycetota bacterium]NIT95710.1 GNAT family N-acetyltransferase [Actinomycetota bacterium]NIU19396.1 GNAT family N-acetyltransferase [Actinomycetota bacterium]NIU66595.1 GNAT family N-acetyltransferase [Actinomycetota bacterium]